MSAKDGGQTGKRYYSHHRGGRGRAAFYDSAASGTSGPSPAAHHAGPHHVGRRGDRGGRGRRGSSHHGRVKYYSGQERRGGNQEIRHEQVLGNGDVHRLTFLEGTHTVDVMVVTCANADDVARGLQWVDVRDMAGVDFEWHPDFNSKDCHPIALVQISTESKVLLLHIPQEIGWKDDVKDAVRTWLENPAIVKVGTGMQADRLKLIRTLGVYLPKEDRMGGSSWVTLDRRYDDSWIDLKEHHVFRSLGYRAKLGFDSLIAVFDDDAASGTRRTLAAPKSISEKKKTTLSRWNAMHLTTLQIQYAAFDAWGVLQILIALSRVAYSHDLCSCLSCKNLASAASSGDLRFHGPLHSCSRCKFRTLSQEDLDSHMSQRCEVAPQIVTENICQVCHAVFACGSDYHWHLNNTSHKLARKNCSKCGEVFWGDSKNRRLKMHKCATDRVEELPSFENDVEVSCSSCRRHYRGL